jgi:hypothetical protein
MTTPTGYALTYTRAGDPQPHWLLRDPLPGKALATIEVCRTRAEANERRRELLATPGITDAQVWTLEETRAAAEQAVDGLIDGLRAHAAATLAPAS